MNLSHYPTPETDAVCNQVPDGCLPAVWNYDKAINHARDLERRLALCRAALEFYADTEDDDGRIATEALTATAPK